MNAHDNVWELAPLPWEANPYRPTDWWEMFQYSASLFYSIGYLQESLLQDCISKPTGSGDALFHQSLLHAPLDEETTQKATAIFKLIAERCKDVGMLISSETAAELVTKINKSKYYDYDTLIGDNGALRRLIEKEMRGKMFLYLTPERCRFWPKNDEFIFGSESVQTAFPAAYFDMWEAGACLTLARATAAVFHLMRVLEIALIALGGKFGYTLTHTNWGNAIEQIQSRVNKMGERGSAWRQQPDWKEQQEFYSQAPSYLNTVKDAWRNYTAHHRGKFTEEEAQLMFENVKKFMQKLSERIYETKSES